MPEEKKKDCLAPFVVTEHVNFEAPWEKFCTFCGRENGQECGFIV
jgi:hypothetical protein